MRLNKHFSMVAVLAAVLAIAVAAQAADNNFTGDDNELTLMSLAVQPLASPPFPLETLDSSTRPET